MSAELDLAEKYIKIANLQADTALKETQNRFEPWKMVVSAMAAGGLSAPRSSADSQPVAHGTVEHHAARADRE